MRGFFFMAVGLRPLPALSRSGLCALAREAGQTGTVYCSSSTRRAPCAVSRASVVEGAGSALDIGAAVSSPLGVEVWSPIALSLAPSALSFSAGRRSVTK